jgi:hypothetical protein
MAFNPHALIEISGRYVLTNLPSRSQAISGANSTTVVFNSVRLFEPHLRVNQ